MTRTVTLSEQSARAIMQLMDLAVKAGGLNVAAVAMPIAQDIQAQLTAPMPEPEPVTVPTIPIEET